MKPRYYPRAVVQASAVFIVGGFTGEGQVLNLTVPGCLIDSPLSPKKGDSLTLRLGLPQVGATFRVALGVVRWVQGSRFGVEFIEMDPKERLRYNAAVGKLLQRQAASHSRPDQKSYSCQSGGVNWHLEEHGVSTTHHTLSSAVAGRRTR
jgi:PilZ domain